MVGLLQVPPTTSTTLLGDPASHVTFSRTFINHGVPMGMAVLAVLLAVLAGALLGYLLARRGQVLITSNGSARASQRSLKSLH